MMRAVVGAPARKVGSVRDVLEWAFGVERANLDFDELAAPCGIDTVWLLMQRGQLGTRIDGGRQGAGSQSASDADIVAGVVAALPVAQGGRGMAVQIAQLARAGTAPDWYPDARPRVVPVEWRANRFGRYALAVDARAPEFGWHGERPARPDPRLFGVCPVHITPSAQQIGAARRNYLDWVGALMHIRWALDHAGLSRWVLSDELPPLRPWAKGD